MHSGASRRVKAAVDTPIPHRGVGFGQGAGFWRDALGHVGTFMLRGFGPCPRRTLHCWPKGCSGVQVSARGEGGLALTPRHPQPPGIWRPTTALVGGRGAACRRGPSSRPRSWRHETWRPSRRSCKRGTAPRAQSGEANNPLLAWRPPVDSCRLQRGSLVRLTNRAGWSPRGSALASRTLHTA